MLDCDAWRLGYFNAEDEEEYLVMQANEARFRDFQKEHWSDLNNHFYIIVIPKTLDTLECCLTFLPQNLHLFLILNGLHSWEEDFLNRAYPNTPKFTLKTKNIPILHDRVLDLLMECNDSNFGIIDQDCFVFNGEFFSKLQVTDKEFAVSPFTSFNKKSNITFPRTYLLLFNTSVIKKIRTQYKLSFKRCWSIPSRLEVQLTELNLGYHNFPHESLNYFDNFQLIWALALHQGFTFGSGPLDKLIHVGAGSGYLSDATRDQMIVNLPKYEALSKLEKEKLRAALFSYYAHLVLLENTKNLELVRHYGPFFSRLGSSRTFLKTISDVISPQKVKQMDLLIAHLKIFRGEEPHASKWARIQKKMDASPLQDARELPANFDPKRYVLSYPDLFEHEVDPYEHFLNWGRHEGRSEH